MYYYNVLIKYILTLECKKGIYCYDMEKIHEDATRHIGQIMTIYNILCKLCSRCFGVSKHYKGLEGDRGNKYGLFLMPIYFKIIPLYEYDDVCHIFNCLE